MELDDELLDDELLEELLDDELELEELLLVLFEELLLFEEPPPHAAKVETSITSMVIFKYFLLFMTLAIPQTFIILFEAVIYYRV